MLSIRQANPVNQNEEPSKLDTNIKDVKDTTSKAGSSIPKRKDGRFGLKVVDANCLPATDKPRPLQTSTNTIQTKPLKQISTTSKIELKSTLHDGNPTRTKKHVSHQPKRPSTNENDDIAFAQDPYDPSKDFYAFDEELYQKVLKLELADDGLPSFNADEPFDF